MPLRRERESALVVPSDGPGAALGKYLPTDAPTSLSVDQGRAASTAGDTSWIDDLAGDDLENAVRDADIEGRSSMSADEKRKAPACRGLHPLTMALRVGIRFDRDQAAPLRDLAQRVRLGELRGDTATYEQAELAALTGEPLEVHCTGFYELSEAA